MRLYLDEDLCDVLLMSLLRKAGHDVESPATNRLLARPDSVQFTFAIHENTCVCDCELRGL